MPKLISECGDFLLFGFVSESVGALLLAGLLMRLLCLLVRLIGVFEALSGAFMPGHVIFFSVVLSAAAMGVGGKVMMLSGDLLRFVHTIARARVAPSVQPEQTKAWPPRAGAEVAVRSAGSTWSMQISRLDGPAAVKEFPWSCKRQ